MIFQILLVSPNEQVVHGIPNKNILKEGDVISIDCGVYKNGFYGDHAYTFPVGEISIEIENFKNNQRIIIHWY